MRDISMFSIVLICMLGSCFGVAYAVDPAVLTPGSISVTKGPLKWNKSTSQWEATVTLKNTSKLKTNKKFYGPFQLIPLPGRDDVKLVNMGGVSQHGKEYVKVNVPKEGLAPGQKIKKVSVQFKSDTQKRFKLGYSLLGYLSPQDVVDPTPPPDGDLTMPTNMDLDQVNYKGADSVVHYDIDVKWQYKSNNVRFEINWQVYGDGDQWNKTVVPENTYNFKITGVQLTIYNIRIRAVDPTTAKTSVWNKGEINVMEYDYPPGPPTNLQAKSTPTGIMLTWDNPPDSDFAGIEIWHNIANSRSGDNTKIPAVPAARLLTSVGKPVKSFFHVPNDRIWHNYWIRSYDSENGVTPTNYSAWERLGNNDAVRGRQGTFGDGVAPPAPVNLKTFPSTWQCDLSWQQSETIVDIFGTEIYFALENDVSKAKQLGVTTQQKATHFPLESSTKYYYWVRNVDIENLRSDFYPNTVGGMACLTPLSIR